MKFTLIIVIAILSCACARVANPPGAQPLKNKLSKRVERDLAWQRRNRGNIFGSFGQSGQSIYGTGGYKREIFNDHRGKLDGQVYGTGVIGPHGSSAHVGGGVNWSNKDAKASLHVNKQFGGNTNAKVTGEGTWNINKNTQLSGGGSVEVGNGKPNVGVGVQFEHKF